MSSSYRPKAMHMISNHREHNNDATFRQGIQP